MYSNRRGNQTQCLIFYLKANFASQMRIIYFNFILAFLFVASSHAGPQFPLGSQFQRVIYTIIEADTIINISLRWDIQNRVLLSDTRKAAVTRDGTGAFIVTLINYASRGIQVHGPAGRTNMRSVALTGTLRFVPPIDPRSGVLQILEHHQTAVLNNDAVNLLRVNLRCATVTVLPPGQSRMSTEQRAWIESPEILSLRTPTCRPPDILFNNLFWEHVFEGQLWEMQARDVICEPGTSTPRPPGESSHNYSNHNNAPITADWLSIIFGKIFPEEHPVPWGGNRNPSPEDPDNQDEGGPARRVRRCTYDPKGKGRADGDLRR